VGMLRVSTLTRFGAKMSQATFRKVSVTKPDSLSSFRFLQVEGKGID
jgi:hypothetical protein